eukprot:4906336-Amphidinium_carterae.1
MPPFTDRKPPSLREVVQLPFSLERHGPDDAHADEIIRKRTKKPPKNTKPRGKRVKTTCQLSVQETQGPATEKNFHKHNVHDTMPNLELAACQISCVDDISYPSSQKALPKVDQMLHT